MSEPTRVQMINRMFRIADDRPEGITATELAEACADFFDQADEGGWLDDEHHEIWDAAIDALEMIEATNAATEHAE